MKSSILLRREWVMIFPNGDASRDQRPAQLVSSPRILYGFYVLLAFVALVEGCSVGPRYKAPTPTVRPFHNPAPLRADGAPAPPLDPWWEVFGDRELTRIVQRALGQNL